MSEEQTCERCGRLAAALENADEHLALLLVLIEHERENGQTHRGMDIAMMMARQSRKRAATALATSGGG